MDYSLGGESMDKVIALCIVAVCILVGSLIGNLLFMYIDNRKRRKKKLDGGCCAVCKYHRLTLMEKWTDENGTTYVDENSGYVCENPKSGHEKICPEFRCKHFKWCYK